VLEDVPTEQQMELDSMDANIGDYNSTTSCLWVSLYFSLTSFAKMYRHLPGTCDAAMLKLMDSNIGAELSEVLQVGVVQACIFGGFGRCSHV
jgi:hypothetical protein